MVASAGAIFASSPHVEQPLAGRDTRAMADEFSFIVVDMPPLDEVSPPPRPLTESLVVVRRKNHSNADLPLQKTLCHKALAGAVLNKRQAS